MIDSVGHRRHSYRREADAEVNWREISVIAVYCVASVVAVVAFYTALTTDGTDEDPAGVAGLFAPLIALSVAAMIVAEAFRVSANLFLWLRAIGIGFVSSLSAYLWMAEEAEIHPSNLKLLFDLSVVWVVAAIVSFVLMPILIAVMLIFRDADN